MLLKQTHEVEIRKLELQLELAKITSAFTKVPNPSSLDDSTKSMGDLEAPHRLRLPQTKVPTLRQGSAPREWLA